MTSPKTLDPNLLVNLNLLTLPGRDVDLERGSPITVIAGPYFGKRGVIVVGPSDRITVLVCLEPSGGLGAEPVEFLRSWIALDLTDATGRLHAAWSMTKTRTSIWRSVDGYVWTDGDRLYDEVNVPALRTVMGREAHLCALPDGSWWRDAEALRIVYLHTKRAP